MLPSLRWVVKSDSKIACADSTVLKKIIETLLFLVLLTAAGAESLNSQLRAIASGADCVELRWRPQFPVEIAGVAPLKKVFINEEIEQLLSKLTFVADLAPKDPNPVPLGPDTIPITNCGCDGSQILRFLSKNKVLAEVNFLHGINLRSKALNHGHDAELTEESQEWLKGVLDWKRDFEKFETYRQKKMKLDQTLKASGLEK